MPDTNTSAISVPFDIEVLEETISTTRTYKIDPERKRIVGMTDDEEALRQSIWKILSTERFKNLIYTDDYGSEVMARAMDAELTQEFLESDIPDLVEDALIVDDRITGISDVSWEWAGKDSVYLSFTAYTIYGELEIEGVIGQ